MLSLSDREISAAAVEVLSGLTSDLGQEHGQRAVSHPRCCYLHSAIEVTTDHSNSGPRWSVARDSSKGTSPPTLKGSSVANYGLEQ
uniref:Uncharacterized protein n=1 Tax=Timema poppense TaxID=170557 RepID=A0A7R9H8X7_TIMPO|nr:unnamed protein product [Timema poppensis]